MHTTTTLTTAHLPADMQHVPEDPTALAVRAAGLTTDDCRHQDPHCRWCVPAAARRLIASLDD